MGRRRWTFLAAMCLLSGSMLLPACGVEGPIGAEATVGPTEPASVAVSDTPAASEAESSDQLVGIDMAASDPCALLVREEAEAILGPLEWEPYASPLNDATFKMRCEFDRPFQGSTPDKSLAIRLTARDGWLTDYDDLERGDAASIPAQEVGLGSMAPVAGGNTISTKLPALCNAMLPCVIAKNGDEWLTLTMILTDRSAVQVEITPRELDYAKQLAVKIMGRLPLK